MSTTYIQTGELKTDVAVTCTGSHLGHGNWKDFPISSVAASKGYHQIFRGENEGSSTICTDGYVVYTAADGSQFQLNWNCTMSGKNEISMDIPVLNGPWEHGEIYYTGRFTSSYYWEIKQKANTIADLPVPAVDILSAEKCNRTSQAEVEEYIAGREHIFLKDCFSQTAMRPYEKIWCAINPLFLTPVSKSVLLRDLAELVLKEKGTDELGTLSDKILTYNQSMSVGEHSLSEAAELRKNLQNMLKAENDMEKQIAIDVCSELLNSDLSKGWRNGVHAYLSTRDEEELLQRQNKVLQLVEARL